MQLFGCIWFRVDSAHADIDLDAVLRAIADPTRRIILDELGVRNNQSLFEICVRLVEHHQIAFSRQAISKHLQVLEAADLITTTWSGRTKLHSIHTEPLDRLRRGWLGKYMT